MNKIKVIIYAIIIIITFALPFLSYAQGYKVFPQVGLTTQQILEEVRVELRNIPHVVTVDKDGKWEIWNLYQNKKDGSWSGVKDYSKSNRLDIYFNNGVVFKFVYYYEPN